MSSPREEGGTLPKPVSEQIGRLFNLLFNRMSMYSLEHPTTKECLGQLLEAVHKGLQHLSPLAVILDKDRLYVEEEALDPRANPQRLVNHMKKAGIQSVSFEKGVALRDLAVFARVFSDTKNFPDASSMKDALSEADIHRVKINHVIFKKVTQDEQIIEKDSILPGQGLGLGQVVVGDIEEIEDSGEGLPEGHELDAAPSFWTGLTPFFLVEPEQLIKGVVADIGMRGKAGIDPSGADQTMSVLQALREIRQQVQNVETSKQKASASQLLQWVFGFRQGLIRELKKRQQHGELSVDEDQVQREVDELTDSVFIEVVKEEYKKGEITTKRMAQIIRRMMPSPDDLKRILPKLKEALLGEGMSLKDYLELIQHLEKELKNEELVVLFEEGAEAIGLTVEELVREVRKGPKEVAELIALAAEIRAMGESQDEALLKELLVDYLEMASGELALSELEGSDERGQEALRKILQRIMDELIEPLRERLPNSAILREVEEEGKRKVDREFESLQREWILHRVLAKAEDTQETKKALDLVEKVYEDPKQQSQVIQWIAQTISSKGKGTKGFAALQKMEKLKGKAAQEEALDPEKPPPGTLNRPLILFLLKEELKRARRFPYCFSVILVMVKKAMALRPVPIGSIHPFQARNEVMKEVLGLTRDVDLVGILGERRALILMPFADEGEAASQMEMIRNSILKKKVHRIDGIPMTIEVTLAAETCQNRGDDTVQTLIGRLEKTLTAAK